MPNNCAESSYLNDCLCKVSKILAEFNKVFKFEKFLIYVFAKI